MLKFLKQLYLRNHMSNNNTYYIAFKKYHSARLESESWVIRTTPRDMDYAPHLEQEIKQMEREYECEIWIINWKKLKTTLDE